MRVTTKVTWWIGYGGSLFELQGIIETIGKQAFDVSETPMDEDDPSIDDVFANIKCESMWAASCLIQHLETKQRQTKANYRLHFEVHIESQLCNLDISIPFEKDGIGGAEIYAKDVSLKVVDKAQKAHDVLHKALVEYAMEKL